jgi:hypothetical protein
MLLTITLTMDGQLNLKTKIMNKIITIIAITLLSVTVMAQEKSKTYNQSRSAKTGRYVTNKETKSKPSTTYTTKRRR